MTKSIAEIKDAIAQAREHYLSIVHTAPAGQVKAASEVVRAHQKAMSDAITKGANPCPDCGAMPHGIEQPRPNGDGVEYEVGCTSCGWFRVSNDEAIDHGARGGMLPRHAVEAWNEGPDYWKRRRRDKFTAEQWSKLPERK